jgi:hypothetical protein
VSLKIGADLNVIGTEVNQDGKFVLVLMFEGKRKELLITGLELNGEWILGNGERRNNRSEGT